MDRILVVEDDATIRDGVVAFLMHHTYGVCAAEDGLQAREIFEEKSFDLVVLDIMLPHEDGLSLLKQFKK